MKNSRLPHRILTSIALISAGLLCVHTVSAADPIADSATKPNILFIFADDWGWGDLGCHGHPYVQTPNIDRLAREGTDFHRFTVASGVCSPSRTAAMTGLFPARFNIDGHFAWVPSNAKRNMPDWLDTDATTLPQLLRSAGYTTAHFGKWHLSNDMIPDSPTPMEYGYDRYGAFNCSGEQMPVHEDADNTIEFIESAVDDSRPFFVNLWVHEPHTPFHVIPKYRWRYRDQNLDEADEIYAAVLSHADDRIGEVLDALDRLSIADNTLVIFSSDNGPARAKGSAELKLSYDTATGAGYGIGASKGITQGRKGYKAALFEGGINVPFIARWPGKIAENTIDDRLMISAVDLLPTFCEIADADLPTQYAPDGISQLAGLQGRSVTGRSKPLFWKMSGRGNPEQPNSFHWVDYCIVDQDWKLLEDEQTGYVELYNITNDPKEQNDLHTQHPEIVAGLREKLDAWKATLPEKPDAKNFSSLRRKSKS
ncbi:MAG: sulfatase [Rhodopirellula sp. JB044]|uniref:sulfatase family protein n=1 Tax=Rhodopirellula sp. JB044 TaxID=3342844 RepID=UPI00370B676F